jgi:hypothetical protein
MVDKKTALVSDEERNRFFASVEADRAHWPDGSVLSIIGKIRDTRQPVSTGLISVVSNKISAPARQSDPSHDRGLSNPLAQKKSLDTQAYLIQMLGKELDKVNAESLADGAMATAIAKVGTQITR